MKVVKLVMMVQIHVMNVREVTISIPTINVKNALLIVKNVI